LDKAPPVSKRLNTITDWPALAKQAHYHVAELARVLGVSMRSFEDYFKVNRQVSPHAYLAQLRIREIQQRARPGEQGQAIHQQVASAHFSSFSRALRRDSGRS
jgi:transcriptional regulator GlxA family with amidase domain